MTPQQNELQREIARQKSEIARLAKQVRPRELHVTELTDEAKGKLEASGGSLYTIKYAGLEVIQVQLPQGTVQESKYYVLPDGTKLVVRIVLEVVGE